MNFKFRKGDVGKTRDGRGYTVDSIEPSQMGYPVCATLSGGIDDVWSAEGLFQITEGERPDDLMPPTHNVDGTKYTYSTWNGNQGVAVELKPKAFKVGDKVRVIDPGCNPYYSDEGDETDEQIDVGATGAIVEVRLGTEDDGQLVRIKFENGTFGHLFERRLELVSETEPYKFKVGDTGKTRCGYDYEVKSVYESDAKNWMLVSITVGITISHHWIFTPEGEYIAGQESAFDLMPPTGNINDAPADEFELTHVSVCAAGAAGGGYVEADEEPVRIEVDEDLVRDILFHIIGDLDATQAVRDAWDAAREFARQRNAK